MRFVEDSCPEGLISGKGLHCQITDRLLPGARTSITFFVVVFLLFFFLQYGKYIIIMYYLIGPFA